MFDSYWSAGPSSTSKTTSFDCSPARATACAALDLLSCFDSKHLNIFASETLKVREDVTDVLGAGGFSHVELGSFPNFTLESMPEDARTPVAVKRSKLFPRERRLTGDDTFDKHLAELATELRILSHEKLRTHSNIVDVLGISVNIDGPATFLSLVTEYAEIGSLRQFLIHEGKTLPYTKRVHLAAQLASGLAAVHSVKIAHGDVKTDNALVFKKGDELQVKLSDFGQSILQPLTEVSGNDIVMPPTGTPLLNAPEVRNGSCHLCASFTIKDAIATDIFSFGLCTWEIIKGGTSFFDKEWKNAVTNDDLDLMISYLNDLPENHLYTLGLQYLDSLDCVNAQTIRDVFQSCLQDAPHLREPMTSVLAHLDQSQVRAKDIDISDENSVPTWSIQSSLQHAESFLRDRSHRLGEMPPAFRRRILEDIEWITESSAISPETRAYAALILADFFASGVDAGKSDTERVSQWLHRACELGSVEAIACYDRVCYALGESPLPYGTSKFWPETADENPKMKGPSYLLHRIHSRNKAHMNRARAKDPVVVAKSAISGPDTIELSLFNEDIIDHMGPIHLASWHAESNTVLDILKASDSSDANARSTLGLNAAHFAAAGGHSKILGVLADNDVEMTALTYQNITALHLAIFIAPEDIDEAINFLVEKGSSTDVASDKIMWPMHRLVLSGTPLQWAVLTRNLPMVKALAPHSTDSLAECLGIAIDHFFLEIAEELISHCQIYQKQPWINEEFDHLKPIIDPIAHWIAHGPEHINIIEATVQFCRSHKLLLHGRRLGFSHLYVGINFAACNDDFYLLESLIKDYSVPNVAKEKMSDDPLNFAFFRSGDDHRWTEVIRSLSKYYTVDELQQEYIEGGMSLFQAAIDSGSVIGVQVLLERGVDVNFIPGDDMDPSWQYWARGKKHQREILSLMQSHGLKISIVPTNSAEMSMFDALAAHTWNRSVFDDFVDLVLSTENAVDVLHRGIRLVIHGRPSHNDSEAELENKRISSENRDLGNVAQGKLTQPYLDMLRTLLKREMVVSSVNSPDSSGMTALHRACYMARPDVIRLLLEVGADPCIPFVIEGDKGLLSHYPLQLCFMCGYSASSDWISSLQESQIGDVPSRAPPWDTVARAFQAALELMRSHTVRGDEIFEGLDETGLAWAMLYVPKMASIVSISLGTGSDDPLTTEEYWTDKIKALSPRTFLKKFIKKGMIPKTLIEFTHLPEHGPPGSSSK